MRERRRPPWWGGRGHVIFTIAVFVTLASLDNAALATIPAMTDPIKDALGTSKTAIGVLVAMVILITALSAVAWGYWGDRSDRKRLLFWGTLAWAAGCLLSSTATTYAQLFLWQFLTSLGLGVIASVGFSVISDFVSPRRRGLAMSFWGLSQGAGAILGGLLASQYGASDFTAALRLIALLGLAAAGLYLFTYNPPRGMREPDLAHLHESGGEYEYRISLAQLPTIWQRRTNVWLIIQGISAQVAYGSLVWGTLLYQEKVRAAGYDASTATKVGGILAAMFQISGVLSIVAGHIGDRLQLRTLKGRAIVSAVGILGGIPFFLMFFFIPLRGIEVTAGAGSATLIVEVLRNLVTNGWVAAAFLTSLLGIAFSGADSPNWYALMSDVNLPEHRGTVFGAANLANAFGRAPGSALASGLAGALERSIAPPLNWAISLSVFQVFFLPTGYCYYRAAGTSPGDIEEVRSILRQRSAKKTETGSPDG